MQKKLYLALFAVICSLSLFAAESDGVKGSHPWKLSENENGVATKYAHWTLGFDLGFNSFDGDFGSEMKHAVWIPSAGLSLEYNFTPIWTLGIQANYDWYKVFGKEGGQHADVLLDGMMIRGQAYMAFDLMAACYPKAQKKIFGLDLLAGGGAGVFKNSIYYPDDSRQHTATYGPGAQSDDKFSKLYPFILAGALFDFNVGRSISLGLKATYTYYIKDIIDGRGSSTPASKNNDGIIDVTLHMRWKLAAQKKTHVKNIASYATFEKMNEKGREKDTLIISHVDTLYMMQQSSDHSTASVHVAKDYEYAFIYFDHDENDLNDKALIDIQQLATRLKGDKSICIEIIGYADNTGTDEYNTNLGYARAKNIRDELVEEHFISPDRITYSSGGVIHGGRSEGAYSPNRRADIKIMSCSEFESVKRANDERNAIVEASQSQAMADRENGVITAPEGLTLSGIARKYYGNPFCWVFIYEVNKTALKNNPNYIAPKTRLVIPDLSIEQKTISKKRAEAYYEKIK